MRKLIKTILTLSMIGLGLGLSSCGLLPDKEEMAPTSQQFSKVPEEREPSDD